MLIAFWIVTAIAALAFLAAGAMKLARSTPALQAAGMGWIEDFSAPIVKLIAAAEVLGAIGLVLPALTGIAPVVSPIAGICLAVLMIGAATVHVRRHESPAPAVVLAVIAAAAAVLGFITVAG